MSAQTLDHLPPPHLAAALERLVPRPARPGPAPARPAAVPPAGAAAPATVPVVVRAARRTDLPALARLLVGCSPTTRLGWYGRGGGVLPLALQEAWLTRPGALVVEAAPGRLVAVAALRPAACSGSADPVAAAVEVMVHDRWQRRGVGTALVRHLAGVALHGGRTELYGHPDADAGAGRALLSGVADRCGARARSQAHPHGRCTRVHLPGRSAPLLAATDDLPAGLRPDPAAGTGARWAMAVPTAVRPVP